MKRWSDRLMESVRRQIQINAFKKLAKVYNNGDRILTDGRYHMPLEHKVILEHEEFVEETLAEYDRIVKVTPRNTQHRPLTFEEIESIPGLDSHLTKG